MNELGLISLYLGWLTLLISFLTWVYGTKNMRTCCYQFFHPFQTLQTPKQRAFLMVVLVSLLLGSIAVVTRYERPRPVTKPVSLTVATGSIVSAQTTGTQTVQIRTSLGVVYEIPRNAQSTPSLIIGQQAEEVMRLAQGQVILELSGGSTFLATRIDR